MTTTLQIRTEIETAERFKRAWERLKSADPATTQGETIDMALDCLEKHLDGKLVAKE